MFRLKPAVLSATEEVLPSSSSESEKHATRMQKSKPVSTRRPLPSHGKDDDSSTVASDSDDNRDKKRSIPATSKKTSSTARAASTVTRKKRRLVM